MTRQQTAEPAHEPLDGQIVLHAPRPQELYRVATDVAGVCGEIVRKTAKKIQGRGYVQIEGWQAIAVTHGCCLSIDTVTEDEEGNASAIASVRRMGDGVVLSRAEGFVGMDEPTWAKRPRYARRAMAQTRAMSRAARSVFAHVVVLIDAGLSTTPAEEIPEDEAEGRQPAASRQQQQQQRRQQAEGPDLTDDDEFLAAWCETMEGRGVGQADALAILNARLQETGKTLADMHPKHRAAALHKATQGGYDPKPATAGAEPEHPADPSPAAQAEQKPAPEQDAEQQQQQPAPAAAPAEVTDAEVEPWAIFYVKAHAEAKAQGVSDTDFNGGLKKALANIGKKQETVSREMRRKWLKAMRAQEFDWLAGRIEPAVTAAT